MSWWKPSARMLTNPVGMFSGGGGKKPQAPQAPQPSPAVQRYQPARETYGSASFDPTYMLPGGGTYSAGGTGPRIGPAPAPSVGELSTPGPLEDFWGRHSGAFDKPNAGENMLNEAANMFRGPNRTAGFADRNLGYFERPGMAEAHAGRALPGLEQKGYTEQLYESGHQGLNTYYDRERNKRQERLSNEMAAMGVFGSGATAKSMYELEAELGAQQARDMADLAVSADSAFRDRTDLGADIAGKGQQAGIDRLKAGGALADLGDESVDRQGRGLADIGGTLSDKELDRLSTGAEIAGDTQAAGEKRKRYPIEDAKDLARDQAGIHQDATDTISDEQRDIGLDIIQNMLEEGTIDADTAEAISEMLMQGHADGLKFLSMLRGGGGNFSQGGGKA